MACYLLRASYGRPLIPVLEAAARHCLCLSRHSFGTGTKQLVASRPRISQTPTVSLKSDLDSLAAELNATPGIADALIPWDNSERQLQSPAKGMVAQQQEVWHQQLSEDRILEWQNRMQIQKALLRKALAGAKKAPTVVDDLPPETVEEIFSALVVDPQRELALRRDYRRVESLALQLEHVLACPTPQLKKLLQGRPVRISRVEPSSEANTALVLFECDDEEKLSLQKRLTRAARVVGTALARRLCLNSVPTLEFAPVSEMDKNTTAETGLSLTSSPRLQKRSRRILIHKAMQSWAKTMNW
ncbi:unnamed protein product [Durusdinium trenchii]|uniref:Transcription factor 25 n=2 Tax=Durusdinium trenchii TaxID=1381693 RepID=A0ABP0RI96_9DINO